MIFLFINDRVYYRVMGIVRKQYSINATTKLKIVMSFSGDGNWHKLCKASKCSAMRSHGRFSSNYSIRK